MGVLSELEKELNAELRKRDVEHDCRIGIMLELHVAGVEMGNLDENCAIMLRFLKENPTVDTSTMFNFLDCLLYEIID